MYRFSQIASAIILVLFCYAQATGKTFERWTSGHSGNSFTSRGGGNYHK